MHTPDLAMGIIWYIVFLFSTTCHEASHALAAKIGGDTTAFEGGQVTLNPVPHLRRSPFGMVVVPIVSFLLAGWMVGWASAPFDPAWQRRYPRRSAWMALAGPAANFALMLLAAVAIRIGVAAGYFSPPAHIASYAKLTVAAHSTVPALIPAALSILFILNLLLGTFNLLPVPPLDGHAAIMVLMPEQKALRYLDWTRDSGYALLGLIVAWTVYGRMFNRIFLLGLRLLYPGIHCFYIETCFPNSPLAAASNSCERSCECESNCSFRPVRIGTDRARCRRAGRLAPPEELARVVAFRSAQAYVLKRFKVGNENSS